MLYLSQLRCCSFNNSLEIQILNLNHSTSKPGLIRSVSNLFLTHLCLGQGMQSRLEIDKSRSRCIIIESRLSHSRSRYIAEVLFKFVTALCCCKCIYCWHCACWLAPERIQIFTLTYFTITISISLSVYNESLR